MRLAEAGSRPWSPAHTRPRPHMPTPVLVRPHTCPQDACVCDEQKLAASRAQFRSTFEEIPGVTVGNWVMLAIVSVG